MSCIHKQNAEYHQKGISGQVSGVSPPVCKQFQRGTFGWPVHEHIIRMKMLVKKINRSNCQRKKRNNLPDFSGFRHNLMRIQHGGHIHYYFNMEQKSLNGDKMHQGIKRPVWENQCKHCPWQSQGIQHLPRPFPSGHTVQGTQYSRQAAQMKRKLIKKLFMYDNNINYPKQYPCRHGICKNLLCPSSFTAVCFYIITHKTDGKQDTNEQPDQMSCVKQSKPDSVGQLCLICKKIFQI